MDRPEVKRLSEVERLALAADLGELLLLVAQREMAGSGIKGWPDHQADARLLPESSSTGQRAAVSPRIAVPALLERQAAEIAFAAGVDVQPPSETKTEPTRAACSSTRPRRSPMQSMPMALPLLERVVKDQPNHAVGQFCVAYCKEQLGRHDSALERYEVAQSLMPKAARIYFHRGVILGMRQHFSEAEKAFSQAIELDPEFMLAFRNRAFSRNSLEKYAEAEADLTKALALGAEPIQVYTHRAVSRQRLGNTTGAAADRAAADACTPRYEADYISRGKARYSAEDYELALADFEAANVLNPRSLAGIDQPGPCSCGPTR